MYTARGTLDSSTVIERYGPMVRRVAAQLIARLPANVEMDDLVQAGMIGLFDALSRYQSDQGAQFETFAMQRVRGAMLDELRGADWLPRSVRRNHRGIEAAIRRLEQRLHRSPSEQEIAGELGLALEDYQAMLADSRSAQLVPLDDVDPEEGALAHEAAAGPLAMLRDDRFRAALVAQIDRLPERERLIMGMYYEQELNLKEIGAVLGVTESRVSQLHSQAVARLRAGLADWA
jgi:RNA polymerase sigma factor for flagellar operon FliA